MVFDVRRKLLSQLILLSTVLHPGWRLSLLGHRNLMTFCHGCVHAAGLTHTTDQQFRDLWLLLVCGDAAAVP